MGTGLICFSTGCFSHKSLLSRIGLLTGQFGCLELSTAPQHFNYADPSAVEAADRALRAANLAVASLHAPFGRDLDVSSPDPQQRETSLASLMRSAEAAHRLGALYLVVHPAPDQHAGWPWPEKFERCRQAAISLNRLAGCCRDLGLCLVLENLLPHLLFGRFEDVAWLLKQVPEAGFCLDFGHAFLSGELYLYLHKLSVHLRMAHVHDNSGRGDDHLPPGQGRIAWPPLLHEMKKIGFSGRLVLELSHQHPQPDEAVVAAGRQAEAYLEGLWLSA